MRIGFITFTGFVFDTNTPFNKPLGGSESGMCYLSIELSKLGHEVILFSNIPKKTVIRGVVCFPMDSASDKDFENLDILVVQNSPLQGFQIKPLLNSKTKLVLWIGHAHDQPAAKELNQKNFLKAYDTIAVVSAWQKENYSRVFGIPKNKITVLRNAIAPAFENMFKSKSELKKAKNHSPILSFTSTPYRGLNLLLAMFPLIRRALPEITLKIYSSLKVYQVADDEDQKQYGNLYNLCKTLDGVKYFGSILQSKLAKEMRQVTALSYTNTFAETSCISVMEAMASGCYIITSNLGGLPETTAGFGKLISVTGNWDEYGREYIIKTISFLKNFESDKKDELLNTLYAQVKYVNNNYTWKIRAKEWEKCLIKLIQKQN
jgi:glycosyltransferase involved in cell wall biosynthesis